MASEQVTVWWIDDHFGMSPATLHSAPGSKSEKQVRYKERFGMTHRPIELVSFTARDAIDRYRQRLRDQLDHERQQIKIYDDALVRLDEIEEELT